MIHEFTEAEWFQGSLGPEASVIYRGPRLDKFAISLVEHFRHIKIAGKEYTVKAVGHYAIQHLRPGDPISLVVETPLETALAAEPQRSIVDEALRTIGAKAEP